MKTLVNVSLNVNALLDVEYDEEGNVIVTVVPEKVQSRIHTLEVGDPGKKIEHLEFSQMMMGALINHFMVSSTIQADQVVSNSVDPKNIN